jgi:hypothetical protein
VIQRHEDGAYCLDSARAEGGGEWPVVNFEFGPVQHDEPVARSFEEWLLEFFLVPWVEDLEGDDG